MIVLWWTNILQDIKSGCSGYPMQTRSLLSDQNPFFSIFQSQNFEMEWFSQHEASKISCKPISLTRLSIRFMLKVYIVTNLHIGTLICKFLLLKGLKMSIFKCVLHQNCWSEHNNTISLRHSSIVIQGYNNTMLSNYFFFVFLCLQNAKNHRKMTEKAQPTFFSLFCLIHIFPTYKS